METSNNIENDFWPTDLVTGILDELIPGNSDRAIPAAGELGVADFIRAACSADHDLAELMQTGFARANALVKETGASFAVLSHAERVAIVQQLENLQAEFFEALLRQTYMGYYSRSDVRRALGLSALPTQPTGYAVPVETDIELAALTASVRTRGPCFRASDS